MQYKNQTRVGGQEAELRKLGQFHKNTLERASVFEVMNSQ
jgi:hypothetical protein